MHKYYPGAALLFGALTLFWAAWSGAPEGTTLALGVVSAGFAIASALQKQ